MPRALPQRPRPGWERYVPPCFVAAVYLALALCYSLMTPAWEANDELDHATYIEYIVRHGALPRISAANGHESHQPPLYYIAAALWQKLLGVPAFTPSARPNPDLGAQAARTNAFLELLHNYTPLEHRNAVYLHDLRLLSVLFGLGTVLAAYGCGRLVFARLPSAVAVGLTVALVPKQLVIDSVVTNDSLVVMLCATSLYLFLRAERARSQGQAQAGHRYILVMGLTLGLAILAKENSAPLAVLLVALSALPALRRRRFPTGAALATIVLVASCSWWFIRNKALYGQFLATKVTLAYLKAWLPPLIEPVPWTDAERFLVFVPRNLYRSTWYDGGWNQWVMPKWLNAPVWCLAGLSALSALVLMARRHRGSPLRDDLSAPALAAVPGSVLAGIVAVEVIAQTTYQAEARVAFAGLVGFGLLLVMGTDWPRPPASPRRWWSYAIFTWPAVLVGLNAYIFSTYLVPLRGL